MPANPFSTIRETVDVAPEVAGEVKTTTCYMCACRCGIRVHLRAGQVRYIEGNPDHPVNRGVLCAKGAAGIMNHTSPARLTKPLLRVGERGEGRFREIEWDEALEIAAGWLGETRRRDPRGLAFFTGRDQSQSLTGWWAAQFGTPNFAAHGGFCSVNIAAGGLYTVGGSFWEFGEPDFERTRYFLMFGVAEDHDSNPLKIGLGMLKSRGDARFVSVNPVRTGYSAIADEWIAIRPGTDGLLIMALIHELLRADRFDGDYLVRYTNAPWLVIDDPGAPDDGLIARDEDGDPLCFDHASGALAKASGIDISPALAGARALDDGRRAVPAFELIARRYLDAAFSPDSVAGQAGIPAATIRRLAAEIAEAAFASEVTVEQPWTDWAGRRHERFIGRPVSMHAMRGISAHSNGFHTTRALHLLQALLGSIDVPGGWRFRPPFPRPIPPAPKPAGPASVPGASLGGMPLGFPTGPEDLLVEADGTARRIDQAYGWEYPLAAHGLMHIMLRNAWAGDPYKVDVVFMYMANMAWNSSMAIADTIGYLTDRDETGQYRIPRIIYSDAFWSETVPYADLVLPDTTYLERWDAISLLDRPISHADGAGDAIRQPVVAPDRDVRPFQDVLIELGVRLALPGLTREDGAPRYPGGYPDYLANHERAPGVGPLAGWRGDGTAQGRGPANPDQLQRYIDNGCYWTGELAPEARFMKHANRAWLDHAHAMGWSPSTDPVVFQLYSETLQKFRLAARGHGSKLPPEAHRERVETYFDPLPIWYPPFEEDAIEATDFPLHAVTQRPMHMYHSWGGQNAWLRQITSENRLHVHPRTAAKLGLADDDWVRIQSHHGEVVGQVRLMSGVNPDTVWTWNAIGKRGGAWALDRDAPEATRGFLLNHAIADLLPAKGGLRYANADPVTGQAAWYDLRVRLEKLGADDARAAARAFAALENGPTAPKGPLAHGREIADRPSGRPAVEFREWLSQRDGAPSRRGHGS